MNTAETLRDWALGGSTPQKEAWLQSLSCCEDAPYGIVVGVRRVDGRARTRAVCTGCEHEWLMPEDLNQATGS